MRANRSMPLPSNKQRTSRCASAVRPSGKFIFRKKFGHPLRSKLALAWTPMSAASSAVLMVRNRTVAGTVPRVQSVPRQLTPGTNAAAAAVVLLICQRQQHLTEQGALTRRAWRTPGCVMHNWRLTPWKGFNKQSLTIITYAGHHRDSQRSPSRMQGVLDATPMTPCHLCF